MGVSTRALVLVFTLPLLVIYAAIRISMNVIPAAAAAVALPEHENTSVLQLQHTMPSPAARVHGRRRREPFKASPTASGTALAVASGPAPRAHSTAIITVWSAQGSDGGAGIRNLAKSAARAAPTALLVLIVDTRTASTLQPVLAAYRSLRYLLVNYAAVAASLPLQLLPYTPAVQRYHHYSVMLEQLSRANMTSMAPLLHAHDLRGSELRPVDAVLLVDARDTLLQSDPFQYLWPRVQQGQELLVVSQEPQFMPLLQSPPNVKWGKVCYGDASLALFDESTRILCSGVTLGTVGAVAAYVAAMLPSLLTCTRGHGLNYDQFIHNMLMVRDLDASARATAGQADVSVVLSHARQLRGRRIQVYVAAAEGAWLCTVGYWAMVAGQKPPSLNADGWIVARDAAVAAGDALETSLTERLCAVVHQFDRFAPLRQHFEAKMAQL